MRGFVLTEQQNWAASVRFGAGDLACLCAWSTCVLWSVAGTELPGDGSNEEILLPPARRLQNKSQSCSELPGLPSCFLCLRTKPEDKPQNAGGDTWCSFWACQPPRGWRAGTSWGQLGGALSSLPAGSCQCFEEYGLSGL